MDGPQVVVHSAVRLPSTPPRRANVNDEENEEMTSPPRSTSKRKRTPSSPSSPPRRHRSPPARGGRSRSGSPPPRRSPPRGPSRTQPVLPDIDPQRALERERQLAARLKASENEPAKPAFDPKAEYEKLLNMRSGGTYIPPARLKALQSQITDKSSKEYQRMAWESLKKSVNGLINKVNTSNIKDIVPELFAENLIRGRGLYCRSIMKAQAAALPYTPIYAAMTAIVNTKLPLVGELLVKRLVVQFRKAFRRNDKAVCLSSTTFIAHLVNQQVAHELLAFEILMRLLMQNPTDDSVEIAVGFTREVGAYLAETSTKANEAIFDAFRSILHESTIDKRVQYMIEVLFQVRRDKYKDNPIVKEELDLVEEEDQITHQIGLGDEGLEVQEGLNVFKFDPDFEEHEEMYKRTKAEILGEASGSEDEADESGSDNEEDEEEEEKEKQMQIQDQSNTNLVNLRRTIYLTIMSSIDFEECCHKLMKITLPAGQELELCSMIIECCSQERTYSKFYGLIGERFCKLNRLWQDLFEQSFATYYDTIHRYETNRLRNIARFFGHQLANDAIGWHVLSVIHLNEEETTSSSRIFVKILFGDLAEAMSMKKVVERLADPFLQPHFEGLFPRDNPRNTRFAINYFTSIGMGPVTEGLREFLANMPKPAPAAAIAMPTADSDSESASSRSSYSSYTGSSRSYSYSRSRSRSRSYSSRSRSRSYSSRSRSRSRSRSYSDSRSRSRSRSGSRRSRSVSSSKNARRKAPAAAGKKDQEGGRGRKRTRSYSASIRSNSDSRSVSRSRAYSRSRSRTVSNSRSRSPPKRSAPGKGREERGARRSPPPPQKKQFRGRDVSYSRSRSRSPRRSQSPPRRNGKAPAAGGSRGGRGRGGPSGRPPPASKSNAEPIGTRGGRARASDYL